MTSSQAPSSGGPGPVPSVVVAGPATAEDVAAVVAVLAAASGGSHEPAVEAGSPWASHEAALRRQLGHGPGTWRTSLRP